MVHLSKYRQFHMLLVYAVIFQLFDPQKMVHLSKYRQFHMLLVYAVIFQLHWSEVPICVYFLYWVWAYFPRNTVFESAVVERAYCYHTVTIKHCHVLGFLSVCSCGSAGITHHCSPEATGWTILERPTQWRREGNPLFLLVSVLYLMSKCVHLVNHTELPNVL